jgi:nucleoside-triphosphatase THEP1
LTAVPRNHLVTGPPRSGKTTVVQAVRERLDLTPGGVVAPERRVDGDRRGFDLVDVQTGDRVDGTASMSGRSTASSPGRSTPLVSITG